MLSWQEAVARARRVLRLESLGSRIAALAAVAVLLPLLAIALSGGQNAATLDAVTQELKSAGSEAARQADAWLDARLGELRVAAGSYVVADNLVRVRPGSEAGQPAVRLREYLGSVRDRCTGCETLLIRDARGRAVTSSGGRITGMQLSPDRLSGLGTADAYVSDVAWDPAAGAATIVLGVPVRQADGRLLGALLGKINLRSLVDLLGRVATGLPGDVTLMTEQGRLVVSSEGTSAELMRTSLPKAAVQALLDKEGTVVEYQRAEGRSVVGTLLRAPQLRLAAVAEVPRNEALRQGGAPRHGVGWIVVALLAGVGLMAGALGLLVARPLGRLARAAGRVAAGDLAIEALPTGAPGELGYVTQVFNTMVSRLRERESQGELERLSVTDALTGLYNRRHLMGTLSNEVQRSRRLRRTFSVLLADVDHFKQYNDTHGHLAGDAALVKISETLRKMTRAVDSVARYGGEEFVIMLLETTIGTAAIVGERIRARVAGEDFQGGHMTVSVGAAEYPSHGDTPEELIASADAAMYRAKSEGRDRVIVARGRESREARQPEKRARRKGEG